MACTFGRLASSTNQSFSCPHPFSPNISLKGKISQRIFSVTQNLLACLLASASMATRHCLSIKIPIEDHLPLQTKLLSSLWNRGRNTNTRKNLLQVNDHFTFTKSFIPLQSVQTKLPNKDRDRPPAVGSDPFVRLRGCDHGASCSDRGAWKLVAKGAEALERLQLCSHSCSAVRSRRTKKKSQNEKKESKTAGESELAGDSLLFSWEVFWGVGKGAHGGRAGSLEFRVQLGERDQFLCTK